MRASRSPLNPSSVAIRAASWDTVWQWLRV